MIWVFLIAYAILTLLLIAPFRISSAESRREEKGLKGESK